MSCACPSAHSGLADRAGKSEADSLAERALRLAAALERNVRDFIVASDQNLGNMGVQIERQTLELQRRAAEKAAQSKADVTPPLCPVCGQRLSRVARGHERTFDGRLGSIRIARSRNWCWSHTK